MSERWVTLSDLHLNREGWTDFDAEAFVEKYEDQQIDGVAYLGDAVSRPDLHDDLKDTDRQWANFFNEYYDFMDDLNWAAGELGVDAYFGNGNHDPDTAAHPQRDSIRTMQDVHEDVARANFASELEPEQEDNGDEEDPYEELDEVFEDFEYDRNDSVEDLFALDYMREGEERKDTTIREYLLDRFDNLQNGELTVVNSDEHDIVLGTSFLGPEYDEDAEQTGGLYEDEEFEELAEMLHEEPFYEAWKRQGGLFGQIGDTFGSITDTINTGAEYLSNAREILFGEYEPEDSDDEPDDIENDEFELPEDFTFEDIPYEEATPEHRRYVNKLGVLESLVDQVERPAIVMDHGMPNLANVENGDLDQVDGEHKGSTIWSDLLSENADTIRSFVGGHFHNKGKRTFYFDRENMQKQDVINPAGTYAEVEFNEGEVGDYTWFRPDGEISTNVLEEPASTRSFEDIFGISEERVRGIAEAQDQYYGMMNQIESHLDSGDIEDAQEMVEQVRGHG